MEKEKRAAIQDLNGRMQEAITSKHSELMETQEILEKNQTMVTNMKIEIDKLLRQKNSFRDQLDSAQKGYPLNLFLYNLFCRIISMIVMITQDYKLFLNFSIALKDLKESSRLEQVELREKLNKCMTDQEAEKEELLQNLKKDKSAVIELMNIDKQEMISRLVKENETNSENREKAFQAALKAKDKDMELAVNKKDAEFKEIINSKNNGNNLIRIT